uniref:Putative secreted protein n=1 Tax=Anopheles darlingi TaxID=43151 RepID=A0A2M4DBE6_ANODA
MQPVPVVLLLQLLYALPLHALIQFLQLVEDQSERFLVRQQRQGGGMFRVIMRNHVVEAERWFAVTQINSDAKVYDGTARVHRRVENAATEFGGSVRVNIIWPLQSEIKVLITRNGENGRDDSYRNQMLHYWQPLPQEAAHGDVQL